MERVAVFGGTFDPLHIGHVRLAIGAADECELDRLIFMPNYISPFKTDKHVTPGEMRCEMIERILHYHPAFDVTRYEIERDMPSYTYETLDYFSRTLDADMSFVLGFDSVMTIETWYRGPELLQRFSFITARRPDTPSEEGFAKIREYEERYGARIYVLEIEPFDASSSDIRQRVAAGEDISALVLPETAEYIYEHNLYR
ncbi:MAG: nicotinate-nucleotide adenylyltransferase [Mogibacterium sp.]|nr:nicotinate-nucleotide adenylyltransferase [Mogibacterium sp.]